MERGGEFIVADLVHDLSPFPLVRESLEKISEWADVLVCSATPGEALAREWQEHDIAKYAQVIAGQELGSKKEHIRLAAKGRYENQGPHDRRRARGHEGGRANGALFYPVFPGHEEDSWQRFFCEDADKFHKGAYTADYEANLVAGFHKLLPDSPPWKR